jgi:hypothetical protein
MLTGIAIVGGVIGVVLGLVRTSSGPSRRTATRLTPEAAIREAMRGREGRMVRTEFRRRGVIEPFERLPLAIGSSLPL